MENSLKLGWPLLMQSSYFGRIKNLFGANLIAYWPLNETSGAQAKDDSGNARHGTYTGPSLANIASPVGRMAPYFDGVNDFVAVSSAGLSAAFDGAEGTVSIWFKVVNAAEWADASERKTFLFTNGADRVSIKKVVGGIYYDYTAGGVSKEKNIIGQSSVDWINVALSWSATSDEAKCFQAGILKFTLNGLGVWGANIGNAFIGKDGVFAGHQWKGWLAHCFILDRIMTNTEAAAAGRR